MMNILNKLLNKKKTEEVALVAENPNEKKFEEGLVSVKDVIAPASLEVDTDFIRIGNKFYRTVFTIINRRFVEINWLSTLINFDASQTVSIYIYPTDGKEILDDLRRKITEMEAEITSDIQRGRVVNPATQAKLEDALNLQTDLVKGEERFFQMGLYITINADSKEDLDKTTKNLEAAMGALMVMTKKTTFQSEESFITTLPLGCDKLSINRNMDTTSLATTFPFVSSDLSDDRGVMFGINEHNGSLVIFDRFSMPNYNSVVFATAGAGKSYMIKLEVLRSLMLGTDIIVIDPENEYKELCEAAGGQYIAFGYSEESKINPFDLALEGDDGENALNSKVLNLHKLFKIMIGNLDPIEESILDKAIMDAYRMKGITPDVETQKKEAPLIEDLYKSLIGMEEEKAKGLAARFEKYIKGSFAGIFNQKTTVNLKSNFVVYGVRNLEESLRPVAMQIILDHIWTVVKKDLRKRILVVDEAWYLMQHEDSASFLRGIVKRGRKYYLGVTTITQDVDDFLATPYGKEIVTNSSIQILLKQHSAAIDQVGQVFYLSEGEKQLLLSADKGEGIFFAGQNHVAIKVVASEDEHRLITSNPEEVMKIKQQKLKLAEERLETSLPAIN
ncbi:MAG TPA: ATP-binding protein, partial [Candidatus Woesebacteria bacterium]|nr:ATP-binding protein [Candidatus Woesebacteria bacterium]